MRQPWRFASAVGSAAVLTAVASASAQQPSAGPKMVKAAGGKYVAFPNIPACASGLVENGDPATGPSVVLVRLAPGCTVPWHWHTPNENIMAVAGVLQLSMKGEATPMTLRAGDYALMPSRHVHQVHAPSAARFFLYVDGPFDIHYVDASGTEIPPEQALKTPEKPGRKPPVRP